MFKRKRNKKDDWQKKWTDIPAMPAVRIPSKREAVHEAIGKLGIHADEMKVEYDEYGFSITGKFFPERTINKDEYWNNLYPKEANNAK